MNEQKSHKKTLFYDQIYLDWALWVGLGFGFISSLTQSQGVQDEDSLSIGPSRSDILANFIDSTVSVAISLLVFSTFIALIRRKSGGENLAKLSDLDTSEKRNRKLFIAGAILVAGLSSAAISHFRDGGDVGDFFTDARTLTECRSQGENELCITTTSFDNSRVVLDLVLTYKNSQQINNEWAGSSSWTVAIDCPTQSIEVTSVRFLDERKIEIPVPSEQLDAVTDGLRTESALLLSNCE
jgi:hypothetical protein